MSTATVSRVLSGVDGVSPRLRGRVLCSVDELGYRPNAVARSLRVGATHTLGLVVGDVLNPFFTELARAVEDEARDAGYMVILGNADERPERQDAYVEMLLDRRVDGLLISPAVKTSPLIQTAVRRGACIVCVDRTVESLDVPTVRADGSRSTAELVDHLVGLGHRRIATIAGPQATITGRERLVAFLGALAAHGLEVPDGHVELGNFQQWSGHAAMRRLLTLPERPTAVFAADNLMALGALQALRAAGLRVPDEMALASFDDSPWFELVDPPITAIAQPTAELGRVAVRALLDVLAGRPARSRLLESRLVVRASCGEHGWPGTSARVSEHMLSKDSRTERG